MWTLTVFCVAIPLLAGWIKLRMWEWLTKREQVIREAGPAGDPKVRRLQGNRWP
jgi:hypothetical protein